MILYLVITRFSLFILSLHCIKCFRTHDSPRKFSPQKLVIRFDVLVCDAILVHQLDRVGFLKFVQKAVKINLVKVSPLIEGKAKNQVKLNVDRCYRCYCSYNSYCENLTDLKF